MKVKVNRRMVEGKYLVRFEVSDFTADERARFEVFGTPEVRVPVDMLDGTRSMGRVPITRLAYESVAFDTPEGATRYEAETLEDIRQKMESLRARSDDYSSEEEVEL